MYVAVKGGERAINNAHKLLAEQRRGDKTIAEIETDQIEQQLSLSVTRVMAEGSLYDRDLAALAIKQARGDLIEAIFLMRAYRTTLPRFAFSKPIKTAEMDVSRRISATFKDLPGGQILGPTFDYTHRLLDFTLMANGEAPTEAPSGENPIDENMPRVLDDILNYEGLIQDEPVPVDENAPVADLTREPVKFPAGRDLRLQNLSRGDEGFVLALGYSTQRGYANSHAFVGEIRYGTVSVEIEPEELGFAIDIGDIELTECETVNKFKGSKTKLPQFTRGYGLVFGQNERKAISMALVDRAMRANEMGEQIMGPAQDSEFVMEHSDNVQSTGFVEHIKLPHYVDFQGELELVRRMRAEVEERLAKAEAENGTSQPEAAE
ncbi:MULTISPECIES: carbon-phosphorus lyase complex subunit PhnI [Thalassospira]|uniref:Carbon-phosphorus lyase complex subunit PhnI n=3 Tax=Thalassospira TaxID=168934 RepID=A0A853L059_9PROT|nr:MULTISPECIES: carbon-phosphorus lyase complex subunit PhnI [Thalassospira]MBO6578436.1 carbon-phosphorus lyase complex subunit PhnI [Thalassospira sp.]MBO6801817.1 carbon-phosphorus lyase complex subunit PhnI [Thalassospira sp.]MBO6818662.1 carbon-phosphorus lyase complex subunit PhnI [Thalassospira sp.]MBO6887526.1 carbon-phosphorus lyase complex subunit PhnI [Thalassospira sp.]NJB76628.1 alpha-D-ribose 1-methylphosphonate 5-triphosphate synthase subunit PhnI [Thalassospira tepidiphila]